MQYKILSKKKREISYRKYFLFILSTFVFPIIICLIIYNYYTLKTLNSQVAKSGLDTISLYQSQLEYDLTKMSLTISDYWANDYDHLNMLRKVDELTRYESSYEIGLKYRTLMIKDKNIGAIFLISQKNNIEQFLYKEGAYETATEEGMQKIVEKAKEDPMQFCADGWQPYAIGGEAFLFRMIGYNGGYTVLVIDLEETLENQSGTLQVGDRILYYTDSNGDKLALNSKIQDTDIISEKMNQPYYITTGFPQYMVVNKESEIYHARLLLFIPYKGYFSLMNKMQMILFSLSVFLVLLIPVGYALISSYYFKPVENLMETMRIIRDGNLDEKVQSNYRIKEFQEFGDTFNQMMSEIKKLKIESCERELQKNRAELQYLQLQIKPHFFLNCLKNLYGMAELKRYDKMQDMVLQISDYLRYFFKDNTSMVSIQDELNYVNNYISLQKYSMGQNVSCEIYVEEPLREYRIPVLLLQPFVENSFKYGRMEGQVLDINIRIIMIESEEEKNIDISISDNGAGFNKAILEQINDQSAYQYTEKNIGIANIKQRLNLLYGDVAMLQCRNIENGHGSICEIILPEKKQYWTA